MNSQKITKVNLEKIWNVACGTWKTKIENYAKRNVFGNDVELSAAEIDEMFAAANKDQIKVLLKFFKREKSIMERITSYEAACKELGLDAKTPRSAFERICIMIKAINQGWVPDWKNHSQAKWYNWYEADRNGVPSVCACAYGYSIWDSPSALYIKNQELARHIQKIADKDYKEYLQII